MGGLRGITTQHNTTKQNGFADMDGPGLTDNDGGDDDTLPPPLNNISPKKALLGITYHRRKLCLTVSASIATKPRARRGIDHVEATASAPCGRRRRRGRHLRLMNPTLATMLRQSVRAHLQDSGRRVRDGEPSLIGLAGFFVADGRDAV